MAAPGVLAILRRPFARALLALVAIVLVGVVFNADGTFFKWGTHRDMLRQASVFGILACGMTVVIISAGIDLAVGSVLALVAVSFSIFSIHWGWPPLLAIPCSLAIAAACGAASGGVIARFGVQPFIATLAMMVFARGLAKYVSGGKKVSTVMLDASGAFVTADLPDIFGRIDSRIFGGNLSVVTIVFVLCLLVSWLVLERLRPGRYVFAIGGNEEAARLSGVPVARTKVLAYTFSGLLAGVAGICQAAQEYQGDPEAGVGYELSAIAIVVIGGTNLMGGRGSVVLTLLGTLTIGYLEKILSINAVGEASRLMLTGIIIISAVLLQRQR